MRQTHTIPDRLTLTRAGHLNESQRSMVAANIANLGQGVNARWQNERGGSNWSLLPDDLPAAPALALTRAGVHGPATS